MKYKKAKKLYKSGKISKKKWKRIKKKHKTDYHPCRRYDSDSESSSNSSFKSEDDFRGAKRRGSDPYGSYAAHYAYSEWARNGGY